MDGRIFNLKEKILKNLQHQWTVEELAELADLSVSHLQKLFKTEVGISPIAYLQNLRLEKSCFLLQTTFWRMKQIGIEVGMPNDSHFTRDFKKKYGVTPTAYRRLYWDGIQSGNQDVAK